MDNMNTNKNKFQCTDCGKKLPLYLLSRESKSEPDMGPVCQNCQDDWREILEEKVLVASAVARNDRERFIFSGYTTAPARLQAWRLSY